jgi:hypothetical protein
MPRAACNVRCRVGGLRPAQRFTSTVRQCPPGIRRWWCSPGRVQRSAGDVERGCLLGSQAHALGLQMYGCRANAWLAEYAQIQEGEGALSEGRAVNLSLAPNPSFERTAYRRLRRRQSAAQLER